MKTLSLFNNDFPKFGLTRAYDLNRAFDLDKVLDGFFAKSALSDVSFWQPAYDLRESATGYLISLDIPGVSKENVSIDVKENVIKVSGERVDEPSSEEKGTLFGSERSFGKFERLFTLPSTVNTDSIEANFKDGVLQILVPKAEEAKPRSVKIS